MIEEQNTDSDNTTIMKDLDGIFNIEALKSNEPVFVAKGKINAQSIIEAGGQAIGLCRIDNNTNIKLINTLIEYKYNGQLLLCLDNDDRGKEATRKIMEYIKENNKSLAETTIDISEEISNGYKDPNEALLKNPEDFKKFIQNLRQSKDIQTLRILKYEEYNKRNVNNLMNHIKQKDHKTIKTGFGKLDDFFGGGLYPGLYVLGAASGVGKTTFILQIADYIARTEKEVLFFSGEMSGIEIIAKSLSRLSKINEGKETKTKPLTTFDILTLTFEGQAEKELNIKRLRDIYINTINRKMRIFDGYQSFKDIEIAAKKCKEETGNSPIIFIDYLQIMKFNDENKNNEIRHNIDKTISELRMLVITHNMPIVIISSLNRRSCTYDEKDKIEFNEKEITLTSFKESGGIEYTADVLMGLNAIKGEYDNEKQVQKLNLKIIKNRHGKVHRSNNLSFIFHCKYNCFKETGPSRSYREQNKNETTNFIGGQAI